MPTPDVTHLIERAISERLVLSVTYRTVEGARGTFAVEPLAIRFDRAKHRVLWCWNRDVGHIESLLWDCIEDATETGEVFAPRPWTEEG